MATGREIIAAQIRADNPDYVVCDYPKEPAQVQTGKPYVDVFATAISPADGELHLAHDLEVHCYAARTSGPDAESEVETIRDNVILSLQRLKDVGWTRAERVTFMDGAYVGYKITVAGTTPNVYKQTILKKG